MHKSISCLSVCSGSGRWLSCVCHVAAVGAAEYHLGDPEANDDGCITLNGAVVAEHHTTIIVLGGPFAEHGQLAPSVEAEDASDDN